MAMTFSTAPGPRFANVVMGFGTIAIGSGLLGDAAIVALYNCKSDGLATEVIATERER